VVVVVAIEGDFEIRCLSQIRKQRQCLRADQPQASFGRTSWASTRLSKRKTCPLGDLKRLEAMCDVVIVREPVPDTKLLLPHETSRWM
jgi:hypothetical protein